MWTVIDLNGEVVHRHPSWDEAVTWAMKHGGEFDVVFDPWGTDADES